MSTGVEMIEAYLDRLRRLASGEDRVRRFFLFQDEELADLEYELSNSDLAGEFYDRLLDQYRAWRAEMGETLWNEVIAYNESLNGANQNGLIDAV